MAGEDSSRYEVLRYWRQRRLEYSFRLATNNLAPTTKKHEENKFFSSVFLSFPALGRSRCMLEQLPRPKEYMTVAPAPSVLASVLLVALYET